MIVKPIEGELWRFHVQSRREPDRFYLVDLTDYDGNGQCACENFQIRLRPDIENANVTPLRCHHIDAARKHFMEEAGELLLDSFLSSVWKKNQREREAA